MPQIEQRIVIVVIREREVRFPAQPGIHGQLRAQAPGVLHIRREELFALVEMHLGSLRKGADAPTSRSASGRPVTVPSNEKVPFEYWVL
jgi:hypothetical protein